jgi:hypothetical protein
VDRSTECAKLSTDLPIQSRACVGPANEAIAIKAPAAAAAVTRRQGAKRDGTGANPCV